jgi:hypothetical protein
MKCRKSLWATLMMALAALIGGFATPLITNAETQPQADIDSPTPLSRPAAEVVKMVLSGAPGEAIGDFIHNSNSPFDLSPAATEYLLSIGIPATITNAMSNHDAMLNNNPDAVPPNSQAQPDTMPPDMNVPPPLSDFPPQADQFPPESGDFQPQMNESYTDLTPYGSWNYLPGSGWGWEPYGWLTQTPYPWGLPVLQHGRWRHHPNRGWLWFPGSQFHGGGRSFVTPPSSGSRTFTPGVPRSGMGRHPGGHNGGVHR